MPEYVYALHDFQPENGDEVPFKAGERIEVVEKDDLYGDGWWQGRNLAGRIGLFPMSYTAPAAPVDAMDASDSNLESKTQLQPLYEASESDTTSPHYSPPPPAIQLNGQDTVISQSDKDGEVMKATMTDVQKAIEQLGRGRGTTEDGDGARSFSFASTRDGRDSEADTDTDFEPSDADAEGEAWHKGTRRRLAEKARRAVEEAEKLEMMMSGPGRMAPPIEVELSDESEGEEDDDYMRSSDYIRRHSKIPEEDEEEDGSPAAAASPPLNGHAHTREDTDTTHHKSSASGTVRLSSDGASAQLTLPDQDESELQTATAGQTTFPTLPPPPSTTTDSAKAKDHSRDTSLTNTHPETITQPVLGKPVLAAEAEQNRSNTPYRESLIALPSPSASSTGFPSYINSKHSSVASASSGREQSSSSQPPPTSWSMQPTLVEEPIPTHASESDKEKLENKQPIDWTVDDVIEWLKGKGFGQDVAEKFREQDITGEVLLTLSLEVLKNEIGIVAYGKRVRIANAITDLRRPPSLQYSDRPHPDEGHGSPSSPLGHPLSPGFLSQGSQAQWQGGHGHGGHLSNSHSQTHSQGHSRTQSMSQSHHSYPGSVTGNGSGGPLGALISPESAPHTGDLPGSPPPGYGGGFGGKDGHGLGDGPYTNGKALRPAQLALSPSDSNLSATAVGAGIDDDERGAMSESEAGPINGVSMRRRLFGRSHDSSNSNKESRHSKDGLSSAATSPLLGGGDDKEGGGKEKSKKDKEHKDKDSASTVRHARAKKSVDGTNPNTRLSIFGSSFGVGGSIGKSRKPPPRYSIAPEEPGAGDRNSTFHLPRLGGGNKTKSQSTVRPSTSDGSPKTSPKEPSKKDSHKDKDKDKDHHHKRETLKDPNSSPNMLRKRTSSYPNVGGDKAQAQAHAPGAQGQEVTKIINGLVPSKGKSILDQIGKPDHCGWMRKRGDRYNNWKQRYFVLKGPHLYCLRSDSPAETKIKAYINIVGYKVTVDENLNPGRYGFRIEHDNDKPHFFSSEEQTSIREWMKAIMKATIGRDYSKPVISSCNIPTIPLMVAQAMNPAPRPPSPTARDATQKALRRENPNQLSSRDARVLMGLPSNEAKEERARLDSFFTNETVDSGVTAPIADSTSPMAAPKTPAPPRPARRLSSQHSVIVPVDDSLIDWANSHLPAPLQITDTTGSICGGLTLLRLAESIKGRPSSPPVPDSAFPTDPADDKLDGLFRLFDFLLDNDVKMGSVSINDIRSGKRDKIVQLLRALKSWEDKRKAIAQSIGKIPVQAGGFIMVPAHNIFS